MQYLTKRQRLEVLRSQLDLEYSSFRTRDRDLAEQFLPERARFNLTDGNRGERRNLQIIDGTGPMAVRTLSSGMMAGITSPARPWMRLTTPDPDLANFPKVKDYLWIVTQRLLAIFQKSNLYNSLPVLYEDLGVFGTAPMLAEEDFDSVMRFNTFGVGSYRIAKDHRGMVNTFVREFRMTIRQLVDKFGSETPDGKPDWSKFSAYVKEQYDRGNYETWIDVVHVIQPNAEFDPRRLQSKYKRFESCYYERGTGGGMSGSYMRQGPDENKYLRESGYDMNPILCPRWSVTGEDVYGTKSPGTIALGDARQLQWGEKKIAKAIDKMIDPAMVGPTSLRGQKASLLPGDITFSDAASNNGGFRPAHEVQFRLDFAEQKQEQVRGRVRRAFFEDLFLMLANDTRSGTTAREIEERHEEKLLALGPVYEQLNQDLLDPMVDLAFYYASRFDVLPPPPEELEGMDLKVEYISVMAQAQKLVGIGSLERFTGFVGQVAQVDPSALDKVNRDELIDQYGEALSVPPGIILSDDQVAEIRGERARAAQAREQAEMISAGAKAAKDLSQTDMSADSALKRLTDASAAGQLVPQ